MNYYPHHIGDFNNATRHLSRTERSLYRDMIDMYYDTEQPLTADFKLLCRKLLARTEEEVTGVEQVLNEFFTQTEQGWKHDRCEEVIEEYRQQLEKKSAAGKASAEARAAAKAAAEAAKGQSNQGSATDVQQVFNDRSTNQEPITNNHKPETKGKAKAPAAPLPVDVLVQNGVDEQVAKDWLALRRQKRLPLTQTALDGVMQEAVKADMTLDCALRLCCKRGWAGFDAEWLEKQQARASPSGGYESAKDRSRREAAEKLTGRKANEQRHEIIDIN